MSKKDFVTVDELWLEYEKAIKFGNFSLFKTKRGFIGFLKRKLGQPIGNHIAFHFSPRSGQYKRLILDVFEARKEIKKLEEENKNEINHGQNRRSR